MWKEDRMMMKTTIENTKTKSKGKNKENQCLHNPFLITVL